MYQFTGFFARPAVERPATLPVGAVWREIVAPFAGVGVSLSQLAHEEPPLEEAQRLLAEAGLGGAANWLFIRYITWGGPIDRVYGLGSCGGRAFGPFGDDTREEVRATYLRVMGAFGVAPDDALDFPPFVRGFWGE